MSRPTETNRPATQAHLERREHKAPTGASRWPVTTPVEVSVSDFNPIPEVSEMTDYSEARVEIPSASPAPTGLVQVKGSGRCGDCVVM